MGHGKAFKTPSKCGLKRGRFERGRFERGVETLKIWERVSGKNFTFSHTLTRPCMGPSPTTTLVLCMGDLGASPKLHGAKPVGSTRMRSPSPPTLALVRFGEMGKMDGS